MQLPSPVTYKQEGGRPRRRRAQGIAPRAEGCTAGHGPSLQTPAQQHFGNRSALLASCGAARTFLSSPSRRRRRIFCSALPRERIPNKAVPTEAPPRDRSWGRTMENPESHGGEAQALVRPMPLYLWGPRVPPKQGRHLRTAPGADPGMLWDGSSGHRGQTRARCTGGAERLSKRGLGHEHAGSPCPRRSALSSAEGSQKHAGS